MTDTLTILIIDDSADDRDLYRRCLTKGSGEVTYAIQEAEDGEQGIQMAQELQPDCILLDYSLPGRDGIEVLKRIRTKDAFVPIVILTGQGNETIAVAAMKEGAQDYITKSTITSDTLEHIVRVAIIHGTMQRRIHEQRTSLEIFTYALAHDLREPTNTVRSFVELILKHEPLTEKGLSYFTHVQKSADRMQQLIDAVYLYTRLDEPTQIEKDDCSVEEVFQEVNENLRQQIQSKQASITTDTLPRLTVNRMQLMQLLQNLLSNAIRHGGNSPAIHLGAQHHLDYWLFSMSDSGPGIDEAHLEKIFEPFKRMVNTAERGLGLGLAISRRIVEFHGGKIWCESSPGKGSTFFFTLPDTISKTSALPFVPPTAQPEMNIQTKLPLARILLVDDNEGDLVLNRIMLVEQGHLQCEILVARDGQEALNTLYQAVNEGNPIDLVVLDINMPVMSGFELLAQVHISDALRNTVVVMCSTSSYEIDKQMALSMGAAAYFTKPLQFSQLKTTLEKNTRFQLCQEGNHYALLRAVA
jgi:signal transduction histidine kinase